MSDDANKDMDLARKVWLAGIGVYGRAMGDAQEAYSKMGKETSKAFDELVSKGEDLEAKVADVAKSYSSKITGETVKTKVSDIGDRLDRMKAALGLTEAAAVQQDQISLLNQRMNTIEAKIDQILAAVKVPNSAQDARDSTAQASTASVDSSGDSLPS